MCFLGAQKTDYTVEVGQGQCQVTTLKTHLLQCKLPTDLPTAGADYIADPEDKDNILPAVIVSVSTNHKEAVCVVKSHKTINF